MKKIFSVIVLLNILLFSLGNTFALSFVPGTEFLDAKTQLKCEALGGDFIQWGGETYCTKSTEYNNFEAFIKAEPTCKTATDGCNTVQIWNGEAGAMTQMYCENIYGEGMEEQWSCLDKTLEDERVGFLSDNDKNQYYHFQESLGEKVSIKIESAVSTFGDKVLKKVSYNTESAINTIDSAIESFERVIFNLIMSYPADVGMSEKDTQKYHILTVAKFELQIMKHRWMKNSGILDIVPEDYVEGGIYGITYQECQEKGGFMAIDGNGIEVCIVD